MTSRRVLHITNPGLRPQLVDIAPDAASSPSKRSSLIENEERNLDRNLSELEAGTKARNREFQDRLDNVWSSIGDWEARLKTEVEEAAESIESMKRQYDRELKNFDKTIHDELHAIFNHIEDDLIPPQTQRVVNLEEDTMVFFNVTVPAVVERQSGEVSRQLKKQYETFDIEKQKAQKKERKFINRANDHMQATSQRFCDEAALISACFSTLEEDVREHDQREVRQHDRRLLDAAVDVRTLRDKIEAECALRSVEDNDILEIVMETQKLLQQTILEHFGSGDGDAVVTSRKVTNVLKGLRERRNSRRLVPAKMPSVQPSPRRAGGGELDPLEDGEPVGSARGEQQEGEEKS